jgi:streptogramin lyase
MTDLEQQLRLYADWELNRVEPVSADSIVAREPKTTNPTLAHRPLILTASTLIVATIIGVVLVLFRSGPVGIPNARVSSLVVARVSETLPLAKMSSVSTWGPPGSLSAGEGNLWITKGGQGEPPASTASGGILRLDPQTLSLSAWAAVAAPAGTAAADGSVWVVGFTNNVVSRFDTKTGALIATVTLAPTSGPSPSGPSFSDGQFLANNVAASANAVWVTSGRGYVVEIDPSTNSVVEEYQLSPGSPQQLAVSGDVGWLAAGEEGVAILRPSSPVPEVVPVVVGGRPTFVSAVTVYQGRVWIAGSILQPAAQGRLTYSSQSFVGVIDSSTGTISESATTALRFPSLAVTSDGLWVTDGQHLISSVSSNSNGTIDISPTVMLDEAHAAYVVGSGAYVWIIDGVDDVMQRVDPRNGLVTPIRIP